MNAPDVFVLPVLSHQADAWTAAANAGAVIDTLGFKWAQPVILAGTQGAGNLSIAVQESDVSGSGFAPALDDDGNAIVFTTITSANDEALVVGLLRLDRRKRYLKLIATQASAAGDSGIVVNLIGPEDTVRVSDALTYDVQV